MPVQVCKPYSPLDDGALCESPRPLPYLYESVASSETDPVDARLSKEIDVLVKMLLALPHPVMKPTESSIDFPAVGRPYAKNPVSMTREARVRRLCCWLPPNYREVILGDLLEDCTDFLNNDMTKRQIRRHISWEILLAVAYSWPAAFMAVVKRVFSTK